MNQFSPSVKRRQPVIDFEIQLLLYRRRFFWGGKQVSLALSLKADPSHYFYLFGVKNNVYFENAAI